MTTRMDKEFSPEEKARIEERFKPFKSPVVQKKALEGFAAIERGEYVSYSLLEIKKEISRLKREQGMN